MPFGLTDTTYLLTSNFSYIFVDPSPVHDIFVGPQHAGWKVADLGDKVCLDMPEQFERAPVSI
jgi:hypothetical protein